MNTEIALTFLVDDPPNQHECPFSQAVAGADGVWECATGDFCYCPRKTCPLLEGIVVVKAGRLQDQE